MQRLEDRTLLSVTFDGVPQWQDQGPNPIPNAAGVNALPQGTGSQSDNGAVGAIESVVVAHVATSTRNPGGYVLYAGTVNGGVWRSDNLTDGMIQVTADGSGNLEPVTTPSGLLWKPLTDQEPTLGISALALDPADPSGNTLWVGTGSLSSAGRAGGPGLGLLETTDGGQTWTQLGQPALAGSPVMGIAMARVTSGGHTISSPLVASWGKGVLYSQNGGQSFFTGSIVNANGRTIGTMSGKATDIVADPSNSHMFYAALQNKGIFRSNDDGQTWLEIDDGTSQTTGPNGIRLAAASTANRTFLYAATFGNPATKGAGLALAGVFRTSTTASTGQPGWIALGTAPSGLGSTTTIGRLELDHLAPHSRPHQCQRGLRQRL